MATANHFSEIAIVGAVDSPAGVAALKDLWRAFRPHDLIVAFDPRTDDAGQISEEVPLLSGKDVVNGDLTFYLCESYACQAPTNDLAEILAARPS